MTRVASPETFTVAVALPAFVPRRADARRSCFASRYSPNMGRSALQVRSIATHGGLTPAALADVRLCTANRAFRTERASRSKSGWRKPAVARECTQPVKNVPRRVRVSLARRADARRSCFARRYSPNMVRSALQARSIANHGGLTPAALISPAAIPRTWFVRHCRRVFCDPRRADVYVEKTAYSPARNAYLPRHCS